MLETSKKIDENEEQYTWRLGQLKDSGKLDLEWQDIADLVNGEFRDEDTEYTSSAIRKPYQCAKRYYEAGVFNNLTEDEYLEKLIKQKEEIFKEKQKLQDERIALNKLLREQARREEFVEMVKRGIENYEPVKFNYSYSPSIHSDNDLVIHISDVHTGMNIDSPFNKFNDEILVSRLKKYLDEVLNIQKTHNSENAYIILGGDMIHGLIHINGRIESKENIIEQIRTVSDILGEFIYVIAENFSEVNVYVTPGNHSRSMANKNEAIKGENFDSLIHYILSKDLKKIQNVKFIENKLDSNIATFSVRGWNIYATHGDKDSADSIVNSMTNFARKAKYPLPDICFLGHRHTNAMSTVNDVKVIQSGCVDGMDNYTIDTRHVGTPEQMIAVISKEQKIKALYDIQLD